MSAQDKITLQCRQAIVEGAHMFKMLARFPEGRARLHEHRAIALHQLQHEKDHEELGWAAWMLRHVEAALKIGEQEEAKRKALVKILQERLSRSAKGAENIVVLLRDHACGDGMVRLDSPAHGDINESYSIACRVERIASGYTKKASKR
jgi:hypothetical protein